MKNATFLASFCAVLILAACATTGDGGNWTCSAKGLVNSYYTGGFNAMIHLEGYSSGGTYEVTKNAEGTEATGTTANGTPFKCIRKK